MRYKHTDIQRYVSYDPVTGIFTDKFTGKRINAYTIKTLTIKIEGTTHLGHRLAWFIMTGAWPLNVVEHINGKIGDNRWDNLRLSTKPMESPHSSKAPRSSGFVGVAQVKRFSRGYDPVILWHAYISTNGIPHCLGFYGTMEEAIAARLDGNNVRA